MPKKAPKVKKSLEEFSPLTQRLLKLRDSDKKEWTESSSDSSQPFSASLNSSEEEKVLQKLLEVHHDVGSDSNKNTKMLNELLVTLNKLQKEHIGLYHTIISGGYSDTEVKKAYLTLSKQIKSINTFIIEHGLNKEYLIYDLKKGSKRIKFISGKYRGGAKDLHKVDYSFF
jgi:hypothetical protein